MKMMPRERFNALSPEERDKHNINVAAFEKKVTELLKEHMLVMTVDGRGIIEYVPAIEDHQL